MADDQGPVAGPGSAAGQATADGAGSADPGPVAGPATADGAGSAEQGPVGPPRRHTPAAWWRRLGLRARLTLIASAGLAVAAAAAALLLLGELQSSLTRAVDGNARQAAAEIAGLAAAHELPSPVPFAPGTLSVQVLGPRGGVINASAQADRLVPLLPLPVARSIARTGQVVQTAGGPFGIAAPLWVAAAPATGGQVVVAAVSSAPVSDSLSAVTRAVVFGAPALFLLLATATWLVAGAALRPIEKLRRGAQEISDTAVAAALPVPESRDEVHSLAVTLNGMLARLAASQQRQRALVSDAAHELRSPIASIRTQLEVAVDHPEAVQWQHTAAGVLADTLRLARLAENLLALARLDEQSGRRDGQRVDLGELAEAVCARYAEARVRVKAQPFGKIIVVGDYGGLDRMLGNLVDNAVRYAGSAVTVTARADGAWALLAVADDGPGIPAAAAERVFDRFTRLDDARSREGAEDGGAGLGLAIVRATAAAHGGTTWLEDAAPGLRAMVRLPAAPGQQDGDRDGGEQQGQVRDRQVEQTHRGGRAV
jgi:signal transduction histidine kinase